MFADIKDDVELYATNDVYLNWVHPNPLFLDTCELERKAHPKKYGCVFHFGGDHDKKRVL